MDTPDAVNGQPCEACGHPMSRHDGLGCFWAVEIKKGRAYNCSCRVKGKKGEL